MIQFDESKIPPLPAVAARVMQFDPGSPNSSIATLERIISPDQGISAELLRVSNSAYYGRSGSIKTLRDAITLLGLKTVKSMVMLICTRTFTQKIRGDLLRKYCIEFPIVTALLCIDNARAANHKDLQEESFLCGLLHRIGMTMLAVEKKSEYAELIARAEKEGASLVDLEKDAFGMTHDDINALVIQKWNLPEITVRGILDCEFPAEATNQVSHHAKITALSRTIASQLLDIPRPPAEMERANAVIKAYGLKADLFSHYTPDYFDLLKENPFYQSAVAVIG